jgi:hypothetical protein
MPAMLEAPATPPRAWLGYLSSTGRLWRASRPTRRTLAPGCRETGASPPSARGRRMSRPRRGRYSPGSLPNARMFRLPGIYGPGRSALDRARARQCPPRVDVPGQVFSRVHVDDIVERRDRRVRRARRRVQPRRRPARAAEPTSIAYACRLLGREPAAAWCRSKPPRSARRPAPSIRRIAASRTARRSACSAGGRYIPDYRLGLRALSAITSPAITSTAPAPGQQRPAIAFEQRREQHRDHRDQHAGIGRLGRADRADQLEIDA